MGFAPRGSGGPGISRGPVASPSGNILSCSPVSGIVCCPRKRDVSPRRPPIPAVIGRNACLPTNSSTSHGARIAFPRPRAIGAARPNLGAADINLLPASAGAPVGTREPSISAAPQ